MKPHSTPPSLAAIAAPFVFAALLPAQGYIAMTATQVPQTNAPAGVADAGIAARADGSWVVFGGEQANGLLGGTFVVNNNVWQQRVSVLNPAVRTGHQFAFDGARGDSVMFGGKDVLGNALGDTWVFANDQWSYRPTPSPTARSGHRMCFDVARGVVVLFGGKDAAQTLLGDTWTWNGTAWAQVATAVAPVARHEHGVAYDAYRQKVVLFGGEAASGLRSDVWDWDGASWVEVVPSLLSGVPFQPEARKQHAMGFDPVAQRVVVFGGERGASGAGNDAWAFDGTNWVALVASGPQPSARRLAAAVGATNGRVRIAGGSAAGSYASDVWELNVPVLPRAFEYGAACVGSGGPLELRVLAGTQAAIGATLGMRMTGMTLSFAVGFGFAGFSRTSVSGIPLPVDLAVVGIPGCNAYNSADINFSLGLPSGTPFSTAWNLAIPNDSYFLGLDLYLQALALEGFGFPRFATTTNGVEMRIGNPMAVSMPNAPVASFTATPTFGTLPLVVQFTDTSTNAPTSWQWDFDNDGTVDSTLQNPTHTYATAGVYSVRLVASSLGGSSTLLRSNLIGAGSPNPALNMVPIAAGTFQMGSVAGDAREQPVHAVTITRPFWVGKYEVTQAEYQAVMGYNPSAFPGAQRPVEQVSWINAMTYCATLTLNERAAGRIPVGYQYRLPTEAEWEYVCRAGTTTEWNTGASLTTAQANFGNPSVGQPTVVGSYAANPWGLFDTHGNVFEWCLDSWDGSANYTASAAVDPYVTDQYVSGGPLRIARGGHLEVVANYCRSAYRGGNAPGGAVSVIGFRVVLAPVLVP